MFFFSLEVSKYIIKPSFGLADVFPKVVSSQPRGAQKQRYQHRVELAPCMAVSCGKTVEPMEVPYTETLPDEEEGSDSVPGR